jgi:hypothetical protein
MIDSTDYALGLIKRDDVDEDLLENTILQTKSELREV